MFDHCKFISECEHPFEIHGDGCYFYSSEMMMASWDGALAFCESFNSALAVIREGEENRKIVEEILFHNGIVWLRPYYTPRQWRV